MSPASNKNVAAETEVTATCNMTLEKISDDQTAHSEPGAESDALPAAVHREMNEGNGNDSPMANDVCTKKEDILEEKESQELKDVRSASYRLNDDTKQGKMPILMNQNLNSTRTDEDSTLRAMKKAARRNLDGDSSGLKLADQALQPVATPPVWQTTSGRSGGILLGVRANVLDLSLIVEGEFYIKIHMCNKTDKFKWILMAVYGPA
ncbi:hypothetical protein U9M48_036549 [Paspalum notatum var. saurae]|uniref:Uncharacterized protein n=1 Tax=Paspalum notatum var. saurae TaxID=547442 RepID=A0AAQ3UHE5_PASNO